MNNKGNKDNVKSLIFYNFIPNLYLRFFYIIQGNFLKSVFFDMNIFISDKRSLTSISKDP